MVHPRMVRTARSVLHLFGGPISLMTGPRARTLQELLAPKFVVFLTRDWRVIGSKGSYSRSASSITFNAGIRLSGRIAAITRIPQPVLDEWTKHQHYSANSRLAWAKDRETTAEEDHVYCLLGMFGVTMPVIYGEGRRTAQKRLNSPFKTPAESSFTFQRMPYCLDASRFLSLLLLRILIVSHSQAGSSPRSSPGRHPLLLSWARPAPENLSLSGATSPLMNDNTTPFCGLTGRAKPLLDLALHVVAELSH